MRKYILIVFFTIILSRSYSQNLDYLWAQKAGGNFTDAGNSIATDLNGNVIVVGTFMSDSISFGSITLAKSDSSSSAMFVAKYNSSGSVLWAKTPMTPSSYKTTNGVAAATDANGNIFVAGDMNTDSINFDGSWIVFDNASYSFVAKYDSNGNFVWLKKAFGAYGTAGVSIDGNGDVLLAAKNAISFDGTLLTNNGTGKHFVVKYSNSGNFMWVNFATFSSASSYGFNSEWDSKAVITDNDNNVYLTGWSGLDTTFFNSTKTIYVANNASLRNMFLVKYNSNGNALWAKGADRTVTGFTTNITANSIITSDNYVYLAGWWTGDSIRFDNNQITSSNNYQDMFVAKFDLLGNNIWAKSLGSQGNDYGNGLALDNTENLYLAGTIEGGDIHFNNNLVGNSIGGNQAIIFKINSIGNFLEHIESNNIPFYGTSFGNAIAIDASDSIFITGSFMSSVAFGSDTLTSNNMWQDMFVCKLFNNYTVGINALECSKNNLKIYPNPASELITIDLKTKNANNETEIGIYSLTGCLVKKDKFQGNLIMMDVGELVNGVYIITVSSNGIYERQKLIIHR
ncbi:MAG: T9SS type A sorting domain-containing protein [Bacteroidia bacterium]|nr:T9SS type A sorting domain-containing protein [Bacteroidia bacterium]